MSASSQKNTYSENNFSKLLSNNNNNNTNTMYLCDGSINSYPLFQHQEEVSSSTKTPLAATSANQQCLQQSPLSPPNQQQKQQQLQQQPFDDTSHVSSQPVITDDNKSSASAALFNNHHVKRSINHRTDSALVGSVALQKQSHVQQQQQQEQSANEGSSSKMIVSSALFEKYVSVVHRARAKPQPTNSKCKINKDDVDDVSSSQTKSQQQQQRVVQKRTLTSSTTGSAASTNINNINTEEQQSYDDDFGVIDESTLAALLLDRRRGSPITPTSTSVPTPIPAAEMSSPLSMVSAINRIHNNNTSSTVMARRKAKIIEYRGSTRSSRVIKSVSKKLRSVVQLARRGPGGHDEGQSTTTTTKLSATTTTPTTTTTNAKNKVPDESSVRILTGRKQQQQHAHTYTNNTNIPVIEQHQQQQSATVNNNNNKSTNTALISECSIQILAKSTIIPATTNDKTKRNDSKSKAVCVSPNDENSPNSKEEKMTSHHSTNTLLNMMINSGRFTESQNPRTDFHSLRLGHSATFSINDPNQGKQRTRPSSNDSDNNKTNDDDAIKSINSLRCDEQLSSCLVHVKGLGTRLVRSGHQSQAVRKETKQMRNNPHLNNAQARRLSDPVLQNVVSKGSNSVISVFLDASPSAFDCWNELFSSRRYPGTFKPMKLLGQGTYGAALLVRYHPPKKPNSSSPPASSSNEVVKNTPTKIRRSKSPQQVSAAAASSSSNSRPSIRLKVLEKQRELLRQRNADVTPNGGAVSAMGISEPLVLINQRNDRGMITSSVVVPRQDLFVCKVEKIRQSSQPQPQSHQDESSDAGPKLLVHDLVKQHEERCSHEAHILSNIAHPNIVNFVDFYVDKKKQEQLLFIEYVDGGDLQHDLQRRLEKGDFMRESEVLHIFVQVVLAVEYCHRHNILHRDIKSQNVLLSKHGFVKLTDFGTAKKFDSDVNEAVDRTLFGTPLYLSPEICYGLPYSEKTDMWSLGVLLYEMLTGGARYPFMGTSKQDLANNICGSNPAPLSRLLSDGSKLSESTCALVRSLLTRNPHRRPTALQVLTLFPTVRVALDRYVTVFSEVLVDAPRAELHRLQRQQQQQHQKQQITFNNSRSSSAQQQRQVRNFPSPRPALPLGGQSKFSLRFFNNAGSSAVPLSSAAAAPTTTARKSTNSSPRSSSPPRPLSVTLLISDLQKIFEGGLALYTTLMGHIELIRGRFPVSSSNDDNSCDNEDVDKEEEADDVLGFSSASPASQCSTGGGFSASSVRSTKNETSQLPSTPLKMSANHHQSPQDFPKNNNTNNICVQNDEGSGHRHHLFLCETQQQQQQQHGDATTITPLATNPTTPRRTVQIKNNDDDGGNDEQSQLMSGALMLVQHQMVRSPIRGVSSATNRHHIAAATPLSNRPGSPASQQQQQQRNQQHNIRQTNTPSSRHHQRQPSSTTGFFSSSSRSHTVATGSQQSQREYTNRLVQASRERSSIITNNSNNNTNHRYSRNNNHITSTPPRRRNNNNNNCHSRTASVSMASVHSLCLSASPNERNAATPAETTTPHHNSNNNRNTHNNYQRHDRTDDDLNGFEEILY